MDTLPLRTLVRNAAAVFAQVYGAVTRQAQEAECSRQTVYKHARLVEHRLDPATTDDRIAQLEADNQRLRHQLELARQHADGSIRCDPEKLRQVATVSFAAGVSLRQIELVFATWLDDRPSPRHATIGRWVHPGCVQATAVLDPLDQAAAPRVTQLAGDEVFFGGARLSRGLSRTA